MTITGPITSAVVVMVIVVVVVGVVSGLAISGSDWLNPQTNAAKQREMDEQTRHEAEINRLEEERVAAKIEKEIEHRKQKMELDLKLLPIRTYTLTAGGALALVIVAAGVAILLARLGYRWSRVAQPRARPTADLSEDVWRSRAYRDARIQAARASERQSREALAKMPATQGQSVLGDDGHLREPTPV